MARLEQVKPAVVWDVTVENQGTIVLVHLLTDEAVEWVNENVSPDALFFGRALAVEPRYVDELLGGMCGSGLIVA